MLVIMLFRFQTLRPEVDEIYQDEELPTSFDVEPGTGIDNLVGDLEDIHVPEKRKRKQTKKRVTWSALKSRILDRDADEF